MKLHVVLAILLGLVHLNVNYAQNHQMVIDSLQKALDHTEHPPDRFHLLLDLSDAYGYQKPEEAESFARQALALARQSEDPEGEARALNQLGLGRIWRSQYKEALQPLLKALSIAETRRDSHQLANIQNNMGIVFYSLGNAEKALRHYRNALDLNRALARKSEVANVLVNIGVILAQHGALDSALVYYHQALAEFIALPANTGLGTVYNNIARIHDRRGEYSQSQFYYRKALQLYRQENNILYEANALNNLGRVLFELDSLPQAIAALQDGLSKAGSQKALTEQTEAYRYLAQVYERMGQPRAALHALQMHLQLSDSLREQSRQAEVLDMHSHYEQEKKARRMERELDGERNKRLAWTLGTMGLLMGLLSLAGYSWMRARKNRLKNALFEAEQRQHEAEREKDRLRAAQLQDELRFKSQELATVAMSNLHKNDLLKALKKELGELKAPTHGKEFDKQIRKLLRLIENGMSQEEDLNNFKLHFENVHPGFFDRLLQKNPKLTGRDLRVCAYLRLNLSTKEIATLLNFTTRGVETMRYRLRKKLDLPTETDLNTWMMQL